MKGKTHRIKQAVKAPKTSEVKLFIRDDNQPNQLKKNVKRITICFN